VKELRERILKEGRHLGGGILKVDGFLNHRLEPRLTMAMGEAFKGGLMAAGVGGVTKIVTAETSGIAPALAAAVAYDVPLVFARKRRPLTMPEGVYAAEAPSPTKGGVTTLMLSPEYLDVGDRVVIVDDFLASGLTTLALARAVEQSGAALLGIGAVIEKAFEGGRERLAALGVHIVSLAVIERMDERGIHLR
jgi:xanthine phosphoribosyltransferase